MKRLALLLGSLLVVSAAASAKEVVPAPVVVEEAPVQIIEKEVIVYRDKEEGFRPNGYVDLQYRYYGDTENKEPIWNTRDNSSRTQLTAKINMTENQAFEARIRDYNSLDQASSYVLAEDATEPSVASSSTETRLRYWYNHGLLGDSKINLDSRLEYINLDSTQYIEYQAQFDFAGYLFDNDFVKTDYFQVAPKYRYEWSDGNDSNYNNQVGVDLYTFHTLPAGFSTELNVYLTQKYFGTAAEKADFDEKVQDKNFDVYVEWYLYNTTNLYTNGNYGVDFVFEGGLDGYNWSQEKILTKTTGHQTYSLYAFPALQLNYQATEFINIYAQAGAEYRNYAIKSAHSARNWRWQPVATVGFTTTF